MLSLVLLMLSHKEIEQQDCSRVYLDSKRVLSRHLIVILTMEREKNEF